MMRIQKSMRQSIQQVFEKSAIPSDEYRPLPGAYYCPITFDIIHVPVIDPEGNTYEKAAILNWIRANHNSPITRSNLETSQLYPNLAIADMLEELKGMSDNAMHPSIRKWKDTEPPDLEGGEEETQEYPTTMEGLEARRAGRRQLNYTITGIVMFMFLLLLLFVYAPVTVMLCWVAGCLIIRDLKRRDREAHGQ